MPVSPRRIATVRSGAGQALQRLVNLISHRSGAVLSIMNEASATLPQVLLLSRVEAIGSASPSDLAIDVQASAPAASQMIQRLVRQGLLHRTEDPRDRRRKLITLTSTARSFLSRLEAARAADYELGLAPLSPELKAAMMSLLQRAVSDLERARESRRAKRAAKQEIEQ
jgi:MarR family transcriptional regulator for hemolysin